MNLNFFLPSTGAGFATRKPSKRSASDLLDGILNGGVRSKSASSLGKPGLGDLPPLSPRSLPQPAPRPSVLRSRDGVPEAKHFLSDPAGLEKSGCLQMQADGYLVLYETDAS